MVDLSTNNSKNIAEFDLNGKTYKYYSITEAAKNLGIDAAKLPSTFKILLENLLRRSGANEHIDALANQKVGSEIAFYPSRVLMQDFTGVPAVVDLAAMRDYMANKGLEAKKINPLIPVDLVIDHSVQVDEYATNSSLDVNVHLEIERNKERYKFLKWGQKSFSNFRVVPPGTGICHQVNLENLAQVVWGKKQEDEFWAYPDTLVGTDSHTTMVNGLSVLGWGVGGIEAEAAMLGQPISMTVPEVVGFELTGSLQEGVTATDLVLTITKILRQIGVVGKFIEFYGEGLAELSLADRATISNMAPEFGATCALFPIDEETINYLKNTGRSDEQVNLVEKYARLQGLWRDKNYNPNFHKYTKLDLSGVVSSLAGPRRPQDQIILPEAPNNFFENLDSLNRNPQNEGKSFKVEPGGYDIKNGSIVIAAITSCTNTSNPYVMIGAGLVARKARELGMSVKPWVKTSLAPGSKVVTEYLKVTGLQEDLDALGFNLVGYGCTTCIGNSGPLREEISEVIEKNDLVVASVLSGNRNFEGRIHPLVRANYLASPMLCVAYAIAGNIEINLYKDPIGTSKEGKPVYLKDIWPSKKEIEDLVRSSITAKMFRSKYAHVFEGDENWSSINTIEGDTYNWSENSTYIKKPPFFEEGDNRSKSTLTNIEGARVLALFGDSITTDHISPAGAIPNSGPAGIYLQEQGIEPRSFNSFGARRGNHEVMIRGTFANIRIKNELADGKEGGYTKYAGSNTVEPIYDVAMRYKQSGIPMVIFAGKEYGTGSSRDWAAKGTNLLGVKAVVAESFERIHRSNLIGMGVLPILFKDGMTRKDLALDANCSVDILGLKQGLTPGKDLDCIINYQDGTRKEITLKCGLDTDVELAYYKHGGILQYVLHGIERE